MSLASQELVESSAWLLPPGETCWPSWKLLELSRQLPHLLPSPCVLKRSYLRQFFLLQFLLVLRGIGDDLYNGFQCHEESGEVLQVGLPLSSRVCGLPVKNSVKCAVLPRFRGLGYLVANEFQECMGNPIHRYRGCSKLIPRHPDVYLRTLKYNHLEFHVLFSVHLVFSDSWCWTAKLVLRIVGAFQDQWA